MFHNVAEERQIDFRFTCPVSLRNLVIHADPIRVKQILYNLLSNAFKFTDNEGLVHVSIGWIVDDDGPRSLITTQFPSTRKPSTTRRSSSSVKPLPYTESSSSSFSNSVSKSPSKTKSSPTKLSTQSTSSSSLLLNTLPIPLSLMSPAQKSLIEDVNDPSAYAISPPVTLKSSELGNIDSCLQNYPISNSPRLKEAFLVCDGNANDLSLVNGAVENLEMVPQKPKGKKKQTTSKEKKKKKGIRSDSCIPNLGASGGEENEMMSSKGSFVVSVKDSGIGIPPQEVDKLFQPFYQ
eukprot:Awhi_evm1s7199